MTVYYPKVYTKSKLILSFFGGLATGVLICAIVVVSLLSIKVQNKETDDKSTQKTEVSKAATSAKSQTKVKPANKNLTLFNAPGQKIPGRQFEVNEVLADGSAIAEYDYIGASDHDTSLMGLSVFFPAKEAVHYYDNQVIKIPSGKKLRQIGSYKYYSETIPVVDIFDK